jgi:hypothetical protein
MPAQFLYGISVSQKLTIFFHIEQPGAGEREVENPQNIRKYEDNKSMDFRGKPRHCPGDQWGLIKKNYDQGRPDQIGKQYQQKNDISHNQKGLELCETFQKSRPVEVYKFAQHYCILI